MAEAVITPNSMTATRIPAGRSRSNNAPGMSWDASPNGTRFLVIEDPELERLLTTLEVVTGFDSELRRRMPESGAR